MAAQPDAEPRPRVPLTKQRVLRTAVRIADARGITAVTMRNLAQELEVEAMSLYHHVPGKDQLLDGMAEAVVTEINTAVGLDATPPADPPPPADGWKAVVRGRILAAREVMLNHPWAPGVVGSRSTMTPAAMRYFDALTGQLLSGGLSPDLVHHGLHALGSRALGFTLELFQAADGGAPDPDAAEMMQQLAQQFPNVVAVLSAASHDGETTLGWCDDQAEFEFGLDLVLDGLERLAAR
ncbi:TetR/AcrR family transcriptional regulator [Pseudonocardia humida]|uniref:TetR/AcrR family transcriptional regulator C-terminal domain-containing protein n=1 Tax=Pseudonocardia humida TaxID=2800819 RepID=A0ABT1A6C2_9PSEU|nr:TetR/AcrR family transcriptional regulator [Pseudonocardia humida]MCO1658567.1 TetR/AcrR family transcriptional regulator C-terminal domain-containing protein [Pseudonocardia humida]